MREVNRNVRAVEVDMECDCGEGFMRPTGISKACNPPLHVHQCTTCELTLNVRDKTYPHVVYLY